MIYITDKFLLKCNKIANYEIFVTILLYLYLLSNRYIKKQLPLIDITDFAYGLCHLTVKNLINTLRKIALYICGRRVKQRFKLSLANFYETNFHTHKFQKFQITQIIIRY